MSDLLRKSSAKVIQNNILKKYELYHFQKNPFPRSPGVNVYSEDERENGTIYLSKLREEENNKFKELLIPGVDTIETPRISFIMDYATVHGRGIGKTAFLNNQKKQIMTDLGGAVTNSQYIMFSVYINPGPEMKYNHFWKITKLILKELNAQDIIAIAICRIIAYNCNFDSEILISASKDLLNTIGNDDWLRDNKINLQDVKDQLTRIFLKEGINPDLVSDFIQFGRNQQSFDSNFLNIRSDSFWRNDQSSILFNDLIRIFKLAQIDRGIILFDEVEKVFSKLNKTERRNFIEALRYYFIDGDFENNKYNFFHLLLTIHPYLQELMLPHWQAAGLDRFASIGGDMAAHYTIFFKPIDPNWAKPLAEEYIKKVRLVNVETDEMFPFTTKALEKALEIAKSIPGKYLNILYQAVELGIKNQWEIIDDIKIIEVAREDIPVENQMSVPEVNLNE